MSYEEVIRMIDDVHELNVKQIVITEGTLLKGLLD